MRGYIANVARVAIRTSKSQSKSGFSRLQIAIEVIVEALKVFKDEVAVPHDQQARKPGPHAQTDRGTCLMWGSEFTTKDAAPHGDSK
jgi:hypothetical protein